MPKKMLMTERILIREIFFMTKKMLMRERMLSTVMMLMKESLTGAWNGSKRENVVERDYVDDTEMLIRRTACRWQTESY